MSQRASLLVVDDEPSVALMVAEILKREGYGVRTATRVDDARAWVEDGARFDLAILDVVMPTMSGDQMAEWLRQRDPDAKVLFLTGYAEALFQARPILWAGESFLEKPFTSKGLLEAVSMALYGRLSTS